MSVIISYFPMCIHWASHIRWVYQHFQHSSNVWAWAGH